MSTLDALFGLEIAGRHVNRAHLLQNSGLPMETGERVVGLQELFQSFFGSKLGFRNGVERALNAINRYEITHGFLNLLNSATIAAASSPSIAYFTASRGQVSVFNASEMARTSRGPRAS